MKKAGGFIALIAGVFGILAASVTFLVGVMGSGIETEGASTIVYLGLGCMFFSFSTIVIGAVAIGASNKIPGILLIISSILGAFLGGALGTISSFLAFWGTLVAICMALAFVGGILSIVGVGQERKGSTATNDN